MIMHNHGHERQAASRRCIIGIILIIANGEPFTNDSDSGTLRNKLISPNSGLKSLVDD
jgi:hypothetical protein